jgi:betaine reductase
MLAKLHEGGYVFTLGQSRRADGGMILRGNDLLAGSVDVAVTDSLTGNMLVKLLSAFSAGGSCESVGWGYGPSVGEAWDKIVSIVSRVSGSTVIANALALTARMVRAKLPALVAAEMAIARAAGLHALLAECRKAFESASPESMLMPPEEPVDAELSGVDVLNAENAKFALWKRGIYAEPYMGCTGLVLKVSVSNKENARSILEELGFI